MSTSRRVGKTIIKVITPHPSQGPMGFVVPVIVGGGLILGTYYVLTKVLGMNFITEGLKAVSPIYSAQQQVATTLGLPPPDPVWGQWLNMLGDIGNFFGGLTHT